MQMTVNINYIYIIKIEIFIFNSYLYLKYPIFFEIEISALKSESNYMHSNIHICI